MEIVSKLCKRNTSRVTRWHWHKQNRLFSGEADDMPASIHLLLDEMPDRKVESITALIGRLANEGRHREALFCFSRMLLWCIRPNEYTFSTVIHSSLILRDLHLAQQIHCCATKMNFISNVYVGSAILDLYLKLSSSDHALRAFDDIKEPNVVSYTTLIRVYLKEKMFDEAKSVFESMPDRSLISWNAMISGCSQMGKNEEALNLFFEMLKSGIIPSQSSFPCAVISAANIGALGVGRSIHGCAVKFLGEISLFLSNSLISFYAKCGSIEESVSIFDKLKTRNVVSWNALISGYAQNGEADAAIQVYEKMKKQGVEPNSVTLLNLLSAYSHVGNVDEGYNLFKEAQRKNPELLKAEHYACVIDLLSRSGRFHEAVRFLRDELPFDDPGLGFWKALLGGCHLHSNVMLGKIAASKILELNPEDTSSYVMVSNAHSAAGRWDEVMDIRGKVRGKRLCKIPGCSWIEIRNEVRVFATGDNRGQITSGIFIEDLWKSDPYRSPYRGKTSHSHWITIDTETLQNSKYIKNRERAALPYFSKHSSRSSAINARLSTLLSSYLLRLSHGLSEFQFLRRGALLRRFWFGFFRCDAAGSCISDADCFGFDSFLWRFLKRNRDCLF